MSKVLILFKGHPGVGKSTLAQALAITLQCPLIDKDDARDSLSLLSQSVDAVSTGISSSRWSAPTSLLLWRKKGMSTWRSASPAHH